MKKFMLAISVLAIFSCEKFGSELNNGKDGCVDCILKIDSIRGSDTTHYGLTYPIYNIKTERTDWCHFLKEMNGKMQTIDSIIIIHTAYCK